MSNSRIIGYGVLLGFYFAVSLLLAIAIENSLWGFMFGYAAAIAHIGIMSRVSRLEKKEKDDKSARSNP